MSPDKSVTPTDLNQLREQAPQSRMLEEIQFPFFLLAGNHALAKNKQVGTQYCTGGKNLK
jgi:hypothetical protein